MLVGKYPPLPVASLATSSAGYAMRCRSGAAAAERVKRANARLPHARLDGLTGSSLDGDPHSASDPPDTVRLLAPFDPIVRDRRRFEILWELAVRFEAYTPAPKRKFGYTRSRCFGAIA